MMMCYLYTPARHDVTIVCRYVVVLNIDDVDNAPRVCLPTVGLRCVRPLL